MPNDCLGQPSGVFSETGSDAGDSLLENETILDGMSIDSERDEAENGGGSTTDDDVSIKPRLRYSGYAVSLLSGYRIWVIFPA